MAEAARLFSADRSTYLQWEAGKRPVPQRIGSQLEALARSTPGPRPTLLTKIGGAVRKGEVAPLSVFREQLTGPERRLLRELLDAGVLVTAGVPVTDSKGRRYTRPGVFLAISQARRGLDRAAPALAGTALKGARLYAGITTEKLARRMRMVPSTIRYMEARTVPRARAEELALSLGLPELLTGSAIRDARKEARWSLKAVGDRVGVTLSVVHKWERDPGHKEWRPIPLGRMLALAAALHEARIASPAILEKRRRSLIDAMVKDVAAKPGITEHALLHNFRHLNSDRRGPKIDAARVLADAKRQRKLVACETTVVGPTGHRRTIRGLLLPGAAPSALRVRLTGTELQHRRNVEARAMRKELAALVGTTPSNIQRLEKRGARPVPLHWDKPLRKALDKLSVETPEVRTEATILSYLATAPGASRWHIRRNTNFGSMVTKSLNDLLSQGRVVALARPDPLGRPVEGFYRSEDAPSPTPQWVDGSQLRKLRIAAGWQATELAKELGTSPNRVTRWETGARRCPTPWFDAAIELMKNPPPERTPLQLRHLLKLVSAEGGIHTGDLPTGFSTPRGHATIRRALDSGLIHKQERLLARRDGPSYLRIFLVAGPIPDDYIPPERMTSEELRNARQAAGLTQVQLAPMIGVRSTTLSGWETGRLPIPPGRVPALRRMLSPQAG